MVRGTDSEAVPGATSHHRLMDEENRLHPVLVRRGMDSGRPEPPAQIPACGDHILVGSALLEIPVNAFEEAQIRRLRRTSLSIRIGRRGDECVFSGSTNLRFWNHSEVSVTVIEKSVESIMQDLWRVSSSSIHALGPANRSMRPFGLPGSP